MERRLTTILSADVVGYSRLIRADEAGTLAALKAHRKELITPKSLQYHGRTIKLMGDGALMEFASVVEAVCFAVEMQCAMQARNAEVPEERRVEFRIGINVGDIVVEGDDIYGDGVNIAARLEGLAEPGGICVRRNVHNQVHDKLDLTFEDLGDVEVKNISQPIRAFRIGLDDKAEKLVTPISAEPTRHVLPRVALTAGLAGLIVLASLVGWQLLRPDVGPLPTDQMISPRQDKLSIAVLPFENLRHDPEQEYFADGMTEDLITELSQLSDLRVISRNSVFSYKNTAKSINDIADELQVRYVVLGSVRRSGNQLRINARMIDVMVGEHIWAERFDGSYEQIFELQDKVTEEIVSQLSVEPSDKERAELKQVPTSNLKAYDYYLRAEHVGLYGSSMKRFVRAIPLYSKAIQLDPDFVEALASYARILVDIWYQNHEGVMPPAVARQMAYEMAGRALTLDPNNARARSVLAILQLADGFHERAIESARLAVSLASNDSGAWMDLALVLAYSGNASDALEAVKKAFEIDPNPHAGFNLIAGIVYYTNRDYRRAVEMLERAVDKMPTSEDGHEFLAATYAQIGDLKLANKQRKILETIVPPTSISWSRVRFAHYKHRNDLEHHLEGLRQAGFSEWPFGYESFDQPRLSGDRISAKFFGAKWVGKTFVGVDFTQQISEDGAFAYRSTREDGKSGSFFTGHMWLKDDMLCHKIEGYVLGRDLCGYVFEHRVSGPGKNYDFVYVNPGAVNYFSVHD